jgi:hypothetical protein
VGDQNGTISLANIHVEITKRLPLSRTSGKDRMKRAIAQMVVLEIAAKALPVVVTVKVGPMLPLPKLSLVSSGQLSYTRARSSACFF